MLNKMSKKLAIAGLGVLSLASVAQADNMGVPLHGFADVGIGYAGENMQKRLFDQGFFVSNLDLFLNPDLGNVKMLAEIIIDASEGAVVVDTERLQIGYVLNNNLTVHAGRFHTPIGIWNTSYHHGAQIQTSVYKPRFIDFEDKVGVIPTHTVGLLLTGATPVGSDKIGYDLTVANGSKIMLAAGDALGTEETWTTGDMQMGGDMDSGVALGGRLYYSFGSGSLDGLTLGVHGLNEEVRTDAALQGLGLDHRTMMTMLGGYLSYENNGFEFLNEYYHFSNKDLYNPDLEKVSSWAAYSQLGYYINDSWIPYVRYERAIFDQNDEYFADQTFGQSYSRVAAGLRYNITDKACIKIEGNETDVANTATGGVRDQMDGGKWKEIRAQWAVRF
jgi:hypothetical protein